MPPFIIPASLRPNLNPPVRPPGRAQPTSFSLGTVYHFPSAGDELPLHMHPQGRHGHISVVLAGTLEYTQGGTIRTITQADHEIIDVPFGVQHGFRALEADSVILNIRKLSPAMAFAAARRPTAAADEI